MTAALLALALAPAAHAASVAKTQPYGVLIVAYDLDASWRRELGSVRRLLKGRAVESAAGDAVSLQRALDRLAGQRVGKIVAVPLETVSESARLDQTRYLFGVRQEPVADSPGRQAANLADKPVKPPRAPGKSALALPAAGRPKRLRSPVPLVLAPALDKSPLLAAILAERAQALTKTPARESLVLAGIAPRSDAALKHWKTSAAAIAAAVGAKAGYRKAAAVAVRDGVRADQQDKDRDELRAVFRALSREGRVAVVPLSPEAERIDQLLKRGLGGGAYRWNGQGIRGDGRLTDWIKASAEKAAKLPDGRQFKDDAPGASGGSR